MTEWHMGLDPYLERLVRYDDKQHDQKDFSCVHFGKLLRGKYN